MATQSGAVVSAVEGKLTITGSGGTTKLHLYIFNGELTSDPNLQSDMHAEHGGNEHRGPIKTDYSFNFSVRISSGYQPEDTPVGMIEGREIQMWIRIGTLTGHNNWKHIVGPVRKKCCDMNGWTEYSTTTYAQEAKPAIATWDG
jgi:hypothetical protein